MEESLVKLLEIKTNNPEVKYASLMCDIVSGSIRRYQSGELNKEDAKTQVIAQSNSAELRNMDNAEVKNKITLEIETIISKLSV